MKYKYKLSIIIPMYNAEKYIARCLDSILNSDLPHGEYEVIIVNDGSTDAGPTIAQAYVANHEDFSYLTQENQGQSVARNRGINECHGEYVWCVDADDIVCPNLRLIYDFLLKSLDADIIKMGIRTYQENDLVDYVQLDGSYTCMSGRDLLLTGYHPASVCNMIFRKSIVIENQIHFIPGIVQEDIEFSHRLYAYANHVYTFKYITYLYLHNSNSTTQSRDEAEVLKRETGNIDVSKSFADFSRKLRPTDPDLSELFCERSGNILLGLLLSMVRQRKERKDNGMNHRILDRMKQEGVYPLTVKFDSLKKNAAKRFFNIESLLRRII